MPSHTQPLLRLVAGSLAAMTIAAFAQSAADIRLRGSYSGSDGGEYVGSFDCLGTPICRGTYSDLDKSNNCSNFIATQGGFEMTGLNLASPGPIQGTMTFKNLDFDIVRNADGTCTAQLATSIDFVGTYTGHWDGTTGSISVAAGGPNDPPFPVTFNADLPPVFPMTVRTNIDAARATASADIQFRPQDVGTQGSVFVFALAPQSRVVGGQSADVMKVGYARDGKRSPSRRR